MNSFMWLEWMNAFIIFISLSINVVFLRIMWEDRHHYRETYYGAVIGITVYHIGEGGRQWWYWVWGHYYNRDPSWLSGTQIYVLYLFGAILAIGAACKIRVFTQTRYGSHVWILSILCAIFAATLLVMLPR